MTDWISIDDELPPENILFLACDCISKCVSISYYKIDDEENKIITMMTLKQTEEDSEVTHWMLIPNLPELDYE